VAGLASVLTPPLARLIERPWARGILCALALYVVALNAAVRHIGGGDAFLLSVFFLPQKSYAVAALALHSLRHLASDHDAEPRDLVVRAAREHGIPEGLALSIARAESGMRPHCISSTGAMGMMQLMPATAREQGVIDAFDPEQNARGAARYLRVLWQRYDGDARRVAAAYNAGPGRVPRNGPLSLPNETETYVARVLRNTH
jgi:soluble lytic murein transglycosylase-like protein